MIQPNVRGKRIQNHNGGQTNTQQQLVYNLKKRKADTKTAEIFSGDW